MSFQPKRDLDEYEILADEQSFVQEHAIELGGKSGGTPSSELLAPVLERQIGRRVRRKKPSNSLQSSGFPQPSDAGKGKSVFARKNVIQPSQTSVSQSQADDVSDADRQLAAMSSAEVQEAIEEIHSKISPEMIEFLRNRSKTKTLAERKSILAQPSTEVHLDVRPELMEDAKDPKGTSLSDADAVSAGIEKMRLDNPDATEPANETEFLINEGVPFEEEKLEWTKDAPKTTNSQQEMEKTLQKCTEELGDVGARRFDLRGKLLSDTEMTNLPTHLGLHHHGADPSHAGYTLMEVILLTRSSVVTQRAMAYSMFALIVENHSDLVLQPLVKSGALTLAFSKLETNSGVQNSAAALPQLRAAESIVGGLHQRSIKELSKDVYFASLFYSAFAVEPAGRVLEALQSSDLSSTFIELAHSWFLAKSYDMSARALHVTRTLVKSCSVTIGVEILSKVNISYLLEMACSSAPNSATFIASDILSSFLLFAGWGEVADTKVISTLFSDRHLRAIGSHMQLYLRPPENWSETLHLSAAASLRVLRAALVFDKGLEVFRDCLPSVCAMCFAYESLAMGRMSDSIGAVYVASREAFLAMESFVHAMYSLASRAESTPTEDEPKSENMQIELEVFRSQINALVPLARSATQLFVHDSLELRSDLKAAAGHFAGSVYTLHRDPMSADLASSVFQVAKRGSEFLYESRRATSDDSRESIVSVVHAVARMLSKCTLPESDIGQIARSLISVADFEWEHVSPDTFLCIRPTANAAAEWLTMYAQMRPNPESVFRAVQLLPQVAEPQVIIELIFKCIAHPSLLEFLNSRITRSTGMLCVEKLTQPTLKKLVDQQSAKARGKNESGSGRCLLVTFPDVVKWWVSSFDTVEHGALIADTLLSSDLLSSTSLYRVLLYASPSAFMKGSVFSQLAIKCGEKTFRTQKLAFHPHWNTRMSSYSSEKRPPLAERLVLFSERLTDRGPFVPENGITSIDALASIVLTSMCRRDAHPSLRLHLWRQCVRDCGGATLFSHAKFFGGLQSIEAEDDDDLLVAEYCRTIIDGLLEGQRCPPLLQKIIRSRIQARLQTNKNLHVLSPLTNSLQSNDSSMNYWLKQSLAND